MSEMDDNFDVQSLFGVQAAEAYSKNMRNRRGTRMKATGCKNTIMTHADSFEASVSSLEDQNMAAAESEQRRWDNFWGLDKEARDSAVEGTLMVKEEKISTYNELVRKRHHLFTVWEMEENLKLEQEKAKAVVHEEEARYAYMKLIHSAQSSGEIINYKWPTRPNTQTDNNFYSNFDLSDGKRDGSLIEVGFDLLPNQPPSCTLLSANFQQSKYISFSSNGEIFDPTKTNSIADLSFTPLYVNFSSSPSSSPLRNNPVQGNSNKKSALSTQATSSYDTENALFHGNNTGSNNQSKYVVSSNAFLTHIGPKYIAGSGTGTADTVYIR